MENEKKIKLVQRLLDERAITAEEAVELLQETVRVEYVYPQPYVYPSWDYRSRADEVLCGSPTTCKETVGQPVFLNMNPLN